MISKAKNNWAIQVCAYIYMSESCVNVVLLYVDHMNEYEKLGHSYVSDYSLMPSFTWVLTMSPFMASIFSKAEFAEIDATFAASLELEYLLNVVCFDYDSLQCKYGVVNVVFVNN